MNLRKITKNTLTGLTVAAMVATLGTASAQDNGHYGTVQIGQLATHGVSNHALWVGSWWAYTGDGIAKRHKVGASGDFADECGTATTDATPQALIDAGQTFCLSPSEKIDFLMGRIGNIDWEAIDQYQEIAQGDLGDLQEERRDLVTKLNAWIGENPGEDWRETEDGIRYLEVNTEIEEAENSFPEIDVDTATEFERIEHGNGVPGVGGWWGHCNAWAAASTVIDEPLYRSTIEHNGRTVDFTPGDVKALITEGFMEIRSDFFGSRHNGDDNEGVTYDDVTPAGFHIYFASQLGERGRAFVIDRYTGDQVWNQSVLGYRTNIEAAYTTSEDGTAVAETVNVSHTAYNRFDGKANVQELGEQEVYPVSVTTTIYWMTDGLPHEAETRDDILAFNDMEVDQWPTDDWSLRTMFDDQVHTRTLTYTLWLDKPFDDENAAIIGDGAWTHAQADSNHNHPDFLWSYQANTNSRRDYENPHLEYDTLVEGLIHPASLVAPTTDGGDGGTTESRTLTVAYDGDAIAIPDNDDTGVTSTLNVADDAKTISGTVTVDITHTWRGDLKVWIEHADETIVLHDLAGGSADDLSQTYDLTDFAGTVSTGDYVLGVSDNADLDEGSLNSWSLELTVE